jgi:YHS domain-containing protein
MRRYKTGLILAAVSAFGMALLSADARPPDETTKKKKEPAKALCPVMGDPVNFTVSTMTEEGPIYFCCPGCIKKVEDDPKKYAEKVAEQRQALAKLPRVQLTCPLSGKLVNKEVSTEQGGRKVYFCCPGCVSNFKKEPAKYQGKLEASYTYQTKCPVSNEDIDPSISTKLANGLEVYFSSKKCIKGFLASPEKYLPSLKKQGYDITAKDVKAVATAGPKKEEGPDADEHAGHDH